MARIKREQAIVRQGEALRLRLMGKSYQAIADEMGYANASGAANAVKRALDRTVREPADELRQMAVQRLDAMLEPLWRRIANGDPRAVEVAIKLEERRAKLLGLDAPEQVQQQGELVVRLAGVDVSQL